MSKDKLLSLSKEPVEVDIGGNTWKLSPPTVGDLVAFEAYMRNKNLKNYMSTAQDLNIPTDVSTAMITKIMNESAVGDKGEHLSSFDGVIFILWRCISKNHSDMTLEQVGNLITLEEVPKISELLASMLFGPVEVPAEEEKDKQKNPSQPDQKTKKQ